MPRKKKIAVIIVFIVLALGFLAEMNVCTCDCEQDDCSNQCNQYCLVCCPSHYSFITTINLFEFYFSNDVSFLQNCNDSFVSPDFVKSIFRPPKALQF